MNLLGPSITNRSRSHRSHRSNLRNIPAPGHNTRARSRSGRLADCKRGTPLGEDSKLVRKPDKPDDKPNTVVPRLAWAA
jgi:hypothetical protein